jgi:hypothetical protein
MSYISREAVVNGIEFVGAVHGGFGHAESARACRQMIEAVNDIPAADVAPVQKWHHVKDEIPENAGHYLAISSLNVAHGGCHDDTQGDIRKNMTIAYFDCTGQFNYPHIEYWMELPDCPEKLQEADHEK